MDNKVIYLIVVAIAFVFLFGTPLFYLGVLNPAQPSMSEASWKTGGMAYAEARGYHVYNPLAAGGFFVAFVIGVIIFLWALADLKERTTATVPTILALIGIIFLFMSVYSFVSGIHDLLTFTKYETYTKPTFGQQYGWLIQFIVYGIIGTVLMYISEYLRKHADETKSLMHSATLPLGAFLLLSTLLLFVSGFHTFLYTTDYTEYRQSLAWVIETFIFGIIAYAFLWASERIRRNEGVAKSIFSFPAASLGVIFILLALGAYTFGTLDYVYRDYGAKNLNWLLESVVFSILGIAFSLLSDHLYWRDREESSVFSTSMFIAGAILLFPSVIQFIVGFNDFLYSSSPNAKWIVELVLLFIPGVVAIALGEYARRSRRVPKSVPAEKVRKRAKQAEAEE